jgi:hypothetical protein
MAVITLGYINRNKDLFYLELESFESCIILPEDLIFVSMRIGIEHIFDSQDKFPFTNIERDIMGLNQLFDLSFVKSSDYRKQNSKFCPYLAPQLYPFWGRVGNLVCVNGHIDTDATSTDELFSSTFNIANGTKIYTLDNNLIVNKTVSNFSGTNEFYTIDSNGFITAVRPSGTICE